ncbi:MAG TPA: DNA-processing protein DprA [Patescibacteria group bacterium]|nr:DNA-processing protein DprA [Patescibacteria group bacterium]
MQERDYYLGFALVSGIGPKRFASLLTTFKSAKNIWLASEIELKAAGLGPISTQKFINFKKEFDFGSYSKKMKKAGVSFVALCDKNYPQLLKVLDDAPIVLFTRGDFSSINFERTIGVVGTRKITTYGTTVTKMFATDLALVGLTIISGLAMGVDAVAGWSAIEAGGKTIAVLGSGIDLCYPPVNKPLYDKIIAGGGVVVSEFPIGMEPNPGTFPSRNRIIAGLSLGVLVTEGAEDSGSLITANEALAINRPAFAIPGPITSSLSKAPLKLIQKGGKLVTSAEDIIKIFKSQLLISNQISISKVQDQKFANLSKDELKIVQLLENEGLSFDEIVRRCKLNSSKIGSLLSMMEIKGIIKNSDGLFQLIS